MSGSGGQTRMKLTGGQKDDDDDDQDGDQDGDIQQAQRQKVKLNSTGDSMIYFYLRELLRNNNSNNREQTIRTGNSVCRPLNTFSDNVTQTKDNGASKGDKCL